MAALTSVLVVDDDAEVRDLAGAALGDCEVRTAASGEEALREVAGRQPDVLILDTVMPGMPGLRVLELLRADPATADLPVILLTAGPREPEADQGYEMGAEDCMVKPLRPLELARRVAAAAARARPA